jgi:homogentisate 1,2-dioxygenase
MALAAWAWGASRAMDYWYRYAHGDEAIFIHEGTGTLESQFGNLKYGPGDYLVIPTGVIWRILPDAGVNQRMLIVESIGGHIEPPRRYINQYGQFLESAPGRFWAWDFKPTKSRRASVSARESAKEVWPW